MPPVRSLVSKHHAYVVVVILSLSEIMPTCFCCAEKNVRINAYTIDQLNAHTINQSNDHIITHTIVSTNVSAVNRPCKRLHVALHVALHEALPKLYQSSTEALPKLYRSSAKALQKLYKSSAKALQKLYKSSPRTSIQSSAKALLNTLPYPPIQMLESADEVGGMTCVMSKHQTTRWQRMDVA